MGAARYAYNVTIKAMQGNRRLRGGVNQVRDIIKSELPSWFKTIPCDIYVNAIREAYQTMKMIFKRYAETKQITHARLKTNRNIKQTITLPKSCMRNGIFYPTYFTEKKINYVENLPTINNEFKISYERHIGYFINIPCEMKNKPTQTGIVAMDPGVRTFQAIYGHTDDGIQYGEIGKNDREKIFRLCLSADKLQSKISKTKKNRRMKRALAKIRHKVKNLTNELHWKLANYLTKNYNTIIIPEFESKKMSQKLHSKTSRQLLTWSHYTFRQRLIHKAKKHGCSVIVCNESYTSKTCGSCGKINKRLGSSKVFYCHNCKITIDRDINGARNILLRTFAFLRGYIT